MTRGASANASDGVAAGAAHAALEASGSAVDAVVAGFFAAAGAHPDVLFAPAVALAAGVGLGARAFDGRAAQPGRGAPRPRGFVDAQRVPDAAYVAVPRSLGMLVVLHAHHGRARLRELVRAGVDAAEQAGANARAAMLREVGTMGALMLRGREVERALLAAGGPVAGGTLTGADLAEALPGEADALSSSIGDAAMALQSPWPVAMQARPSDVIVACDGWGAIAALAYVRAHDGVAVPDLELVVGRDAVPVRRGIPRVTPGTPLPAAGPIAIVQRGTFAAAVALPGKPTLDAGVLEVIVRGGTIEAALDELRGRHQATRAIAVLRDERGARAAGVGNAASSDPGRGVD